MTSKAVAAWVLATLVFCAHLPPPAAAGEPEWPVVQAYRASAGLDIDVTPDGGFIVVGRTFKGSDPDHSYWVLRTDNDGKSLWERTYGSELLVDKATVVALPDGGFAIAGYKTPLEKQTREFWILRTDNEGEPVWERTFKPDEFEWWGSGSRLPLGQLSGGDLVVAGSMSKRSRNPIRMLRLNSHGSTVWEKVFGGEESPSLNALVVNRSDEIFLIGHSIAGGKKGRLWLVQLNARGELIWERSHTLSWEYTIFGSAALPKGGIALAGRYRPKGTTDSAVWVARFDEHGEPLWSRRYGGPKSERAVGIAALADGGLAVIAGSSSRGAGNQDFWILRLDSRGNILWDRTFGTRDQEYPRAVKSLPHGEFVAVVTTTCEGVATWIVRYPASAVPPRRVERKEGLGVGRPCIEWALDGGFGGRLTFRPAGEVDGQPRVIGELPDGFTMVELVGPLDDLVRASASWPGELTDKETSVFLVYFLIMAMPRSMPGRNWLRNNLPKLADAPKVMEIIEGREITLSHDHATKVTRVSVRPAP